MKPQLSVIIPIYKVEKYLERCVKSVLNQDYSDLEVILVEDGSPDRCPQICDELAMTDNRILVIHKSNGGLSSARNAGIEIAKGEFLTFLDSDDQWMDGILKVVMQHVERSNVDLLIFNSINLYDDGTLMKTACPEYIKPGVSVYDIKQMYELLINCGNLQEQAGTHIIKRNFVLKNALFYEVGLLGEDSEWMMRVLRIVEKVAVSDAYLQIYTAGRPGAITRTTTTRNVQNLIDVINKSLVFYKSLNKTCLRKFELAQCSYLWATALGLFNYVAKEDRENIKKQLQYIKRDLNLSDHPKSRLAGIVYKFLGFNLTAFVLGIYIKLHRRNLVNKKVKVKQ